MKRMQNGWKNSQLLYMFKKAFCTCVAAFLIVSCQTGKDAEAYHRRIIEIQNQLADALFTIDRYMEYADTVHLTEALTSTSLLVSHLLESLEKEGPFGRDTLLFAAALKLVKDYQSVLDEELTAMGEIVSQPGEVTPAGDQKIKSLRKKLLQKIILSEKEFARAEARFRYKYLKGYTGHEADTTLFEEGQDTLPDNTKEKTL